MVRSRAQSMAEQSSVSYSHHQIKSHVVLLRTQIHERQRHLGIALIPLGINAVRHHVSDHAVTHALFVPLGQIRENDASHRVNCLATIRGQFLQIFLNGLGAALHNPISFTGLLAKTTKADTTRAKSTQAQNGITAEGNVRKKYEFKTEVLQAVEKPGGGVVTAKLSGTFPGSPVDLD